MRHYSLNIDIHADALQYCIYAKEEINIAISLIRKEFPNTTNEDAIKIFQLASALAGHNNTDGVDIVATTPISFKTISF